MNVFDLMGMSMTPIGLCLLAVALLVAGIFAFLIGDW